MPIADWGLRIAEYHPKSAFRNPKSEIRNMLPLHVPGRADAVPLGVSLSVFCGLCHSGGVERYREPLGRVLVQSFVHGRVIVRTLNLDMEVLHLDYNAEKLDDLKAKYGPDVELEIASPETRFLLSSHHPTVTAGDMIREFELESVADYFDRANRIRSEALAKADKAVD